MHVGSILVGFVLLAALGVVVARPWRRTVVQRPASVPPADHHAEYETLVAAIRDLDFDYRAGVVTEADYRPLRDDLAAQAVALMQALDHQPSEEASSAAATSIEEQIEAAVSALRAQRHTEPRNMKDKETWRQGEGESARGHLGTSSPPHPVTPSPVHPSTPARVVCPECGHRARAGSRFCAQCGAALEQTCPDCGARVEVDDRFCGTCGESLAERAVA